MNHFIFIVLFFSTNLLLCFASQSSVGHDLIFMFFLCSNHNDKSLTSFFFFLYLLMKYDNSITDNNYFMLNSSRNEIFDEV